MGKRRTAQVSIESMRGHCQPSLGVSYFEQEIDVASFLLKVTNYSGRVREESAGFTGYFWEFQTGEASKLMDDVPRRLLLVETHNSFDGRLTAFIATHYEMSAHERSRAVE